MPADYHGAEMVLRKKKNRIFQPALWLLLAVERDSIKERGTFKKRGLSD
jgi:hypothetical protein